MNCPDCDVKAKCIDSRLKDGQTRRRYECKSCSKRFTTTEFIDDRIRRGKKKLGIQVPVARAAEYRRLRRKGFTAAEIYKAMGLV